MLKVVISSIGLFVIGLLTGCSLLTSNYQPKQSDLSSNNNVLMQSNKTTKDIVYSSTKLSVNLDENTVIDYKENASRSPSIVIRFGGKQKVVNNKYPSLPVVSPNKNTIAYISPSTWEELGEVFVYDATNNQNRLVLKKSALVFQTTPKAVAWMDNSHLLIVIGYAYGTITVGGDLYLLDISSERLSLIKKYNWSEQEIKDIDVDGERVLLSIANFTKRMDRYNISREVISFKEILKHAK